MVRSSNEEKPQHADACFNELLDEFEKEGYAVYRVNTRFQEWAARVSIWMLTRRSDQSQGRTGG